MICSPSACQKTIQPIDMILCLLTRCLLSLAIEAWVHWIHGYCQIMHQTSYLLILFSTVSRLRLQRVISSTSPLLVFRRSSTSPRRKDNSSDMFCKCCSSSTRSSWSLVPVLFCSWLCAKSPKDMDMIGNRQNPTSERVLEKYISVVLVNSIYFKTHHCFCFKDNYTNVFV